MTKIADPTAFKPMKVTANRNIEVGFELEPITKCVSLDKIRLYRSQWPKTRNWHNDYDIAHNWGMDAPLVFASQVMEYLGEMLVKFFGVGYLGGNLSLSIVQPMYPDDTITTRGVVIEKVTEGNKIRLVLDVWCENQKGEKVIAGKASGLV